MKIIFRGALLAGFLALAVPASAKTITITQPTGGTFRNGQSMTITWTKDFSVTGAPANRVLIKLYNRDGDITTEFDLIDEVNVNHGQYVWADVGHTKTKNVPSDSNYFIALIMKTDPATSATSGEFAVRPRFMQAAKSAFLGATTTIHIYLPVEGITYHFNEGEPLLWDRTLIGAYDKLYFYVRRPDGSNAAFNQMFGTAPNTANTQADGDFSCQSGKCGLYYINITKDTLLPSPNDQYYLDIFTADHKYTGKSPLFYWK